jgi:cobalt-precorrin 5A hydrolase
MVVGEAMIVAGIGCRRGVTKRDVLAAIEAALEAHGLALGALSALATTDFKRDEEAIFAAGEALGLRVIVVENDAQAAVSEQSDRCIPPHPASASLGHPLPNGERKSDTPRQPAMSAAKTNAEPSRTSSPQRREGGRAKRRPDEGDLVISPASGEGSRANTLSHSDLSLALAGTPSVSETAALSAAGQGARLLGPRIVLGSVTCALASGRDAA